MDDIFIRLTQLPSRVKAMTVLDENADFNIYINSTLSKDEMRKAYLHEVQHIEKKHFDKEISVAQAESEIEE
jgi:hypothetical protein